MVLSHVQPEKIVPLSPPNMFYHNESQTGLKRWIFILEIDRKLQQEKSVSECRKPWFTTLLTTWNSSAGQDFVDAMVEENSIFFVSATTMGHDI